MPASGKSSAIDTTMPLPMAVPRCNWNLSMAVTRSSRLRVGGCTTEAVPAKATIPTLMLRGSSAKNALAASCDATSRLGLTSVARMLPDTSMASMMVCWSEGNVTTANGRDEATSMAASENKKSTGGIWRRTLWPLPMASRTMDRLAYCRAFFFLRRSSHTYSSTSRGKASNNHRNWGHKNVMVCSLKRLVSGVSAVRRPTRPCCAVCADR